MHVTEQEQRAIVLIRDFEIEVVLYIKNLTDLFFLMEDQLGQFCFGLFNFFILLLSHNVSSKLAISWGNPMNERVSS